MDRFLKKVGISKGDLSINLDSSRFFLGDTLSGSVDYRLKKPAEGKKLWVEVKATQKITQPRPTRVRRDDKWVTELHSSTRTLTLFQERRQLDGYHLYDQGSYRFEIGLPPELPQTAPESDLAKAAEMVQAVFSGIPVSRGRIKWRVESRLEIPWALGVSDVQDLRVDGPLPGPPVPAGGENFCGECGKPRQPRNKFCPHCGRKF